MTLRIAFEARAASHSEPRGSLREVARLAHVRLLSDAAVAFSKKGNTLLFGWAFRRSDNRACDELGDDEVREIEARGAEWAVKHLWGNYLLAWKEPAGDVHVLRSPVTGPALFFAEDGACAFSHLEIGKAMGLSLDRLDPAAIDAQLRFPILRGPATGIAMVRELLAGETLTMGSPAVVRQAWSPWSFTVRPPVEASLDELRRHVMSAVGAWSTRFERVQLELSGGLDSSIVAASLARTRATWRAVTLVTRRPDGDERRYAHAVADHADIALLEILLNAAPPDPLAALGEPRVRPGGFGLIDESDIRLCEAAEGYGAGAIFTGVGGDNLFGYIISAAPVVDALRFAGIGAAWRAASDLGRLTNTHMLEAWRFAIRRLLKRPPPWPRDERFLASRHASTVPEHPWFADASAASDGQRAYVGMLMRILPFLDGYDRAFHVPVIAPLLSQPLVEYGLGVPVWQWSAGGHDRSLARKAFAGDLPALVLQRRTKGGLESLFVPAYDRNRAHLRDFLQEGLLAALGIIDCDAIGAATARPAGALDNDYVRILQLVDMERWARSVAGAPTAGGQ